MSHPSRTTPVGSDARVPLLPLNRDLSRELVVLTHGLVSHRLIMFPLSRQLRRAGFQTALWGYRSTRHDVATHGQRFRAALENYQHREGLQALHIVAHSLGNIVTRQALLYDQPHRLGRIVMIGPPNQGSHVATRLSPWFGRVCRTLQEISDLPSSFVNQMPDSLGQRAEIGLLIASGDWVVARENTTLPGIQQQLEIPGMHTGILFKSATARATVNFLVHGRFFDEKCPQNDTSR
ncbi:MAG: hypothetical protein R3C53_18140 [Pirellulaceae bacterium]